MRGTSFGTDNKELVLHVVRCGVLSCVQLFVTLQTVARHVPLSMESSRQESLSGLPFPTPGDLPDTGIKPRSPALAGGSLPLPYLGTVLRSHQTKYRKLS